MHGKFTLKDEFPYKKHKNYYRATREQFLELHVSQETES